MTSNALKIFLVDDSEGDLLLMTTAASEEGRVDVIGTATNGMEALASLREEKEGGPGMPHLILLDINMPRMNGFETLAELKRDRALRKLPVIVLSTSARQEDAIRAYSLGAASFISKPNQFRQLVNVLRVLREYWGPVALLPSQD